MSRFRLSRRALLRGAGAAVALPVLEAMLDSTGIALADGTPLPKRFVTFFFGNGVILRRWTPAATGATWALSEELAPLASVKDYLNVVSGYQVKTPDLRGHHTGSTAILSGYPMVQLPAGSAPFASKFGGPTIDQLIADSIGTTSAFRSLQLAVSKRPLTDQGPTLLYISHRGPDSPLPPEIDPVTLYNRLFTAAGPHDPADPRDRMRASVLDAVKEDAHRLSARLGAQDRQRLDAHLTGISELRSRIMVMPPVRSPACTFPGAPTQRNVDTGGAEPLAAVSRVMSDLVALAFACDLTRVVSFQFSGASGNTVFSEVGQTEAEHLLSHDYMKQDLIHAAVLYVVQSFAYFLERLKATPEGTGNLLDQSCVFLTTDVTEGLVHSISDYPILIAGKAGGALTYPGVHHRSASSENTSNILLTLLQVMGTGRTSVGGDSGLSTTPCTGILA